MKTTIARSICLFAPFLGAAALGYGDIIFDNFDPGGGFHDQFNLVAADGRDDQLFGISATRAAAKFTVTCSDFALTSVTLPISVQGNPRDLFQLRLCEDDNNAPGATVEILSTNEDVWPVFTNPFTTATTVNSSANPVLRKDRSYWIVTEPTAIPAGADVDYRWFYNTSGIQVPARQQQERDALPMDPWPGIPTSLNLAFRVEGNPLSTDPGLTIRFSEVELCWQTCLGKAYRLQYSESLAPDDWINLGDVVIGDGTRQCLTDAVEEGNPRRFYRVIEVIDP